MPIDKMTIAGWIAALLAMTSSPSLSAADPAPFELSGPALRIMVARGDQTLPIGQVPSLSEGDRLAIRADLPPDQGARFILVSAFLRGATNPPPKDWVQFAETWKKKAKDRELTLTVPEGARQMVLFLVPDTGGAEGTLSDAVRGKPGEFVRATQDLNQASLDRSRLDSFMAAIQAQENTHPEYLRTLAPILARSLSMKLNEDCLSKVIEMQAACLLDNRESLVLADVHSSSMAETLTGAPTDLALQLSATREAGYGYYSPYIGVARDIARIFGAFSNPEFDYLPTLTVRKGDAMQLLLNAAPSFQKPKSVMVVAMPAIEADSPPRLRSGAQGPICALRPDAVLPVEGAPLIYSTAYARDMKLTLKHGSGDLVDVPVVSRADRGGYAFADSAQLRTMQGSIRGHLHGLWGFNRFDGPDFTVQLPDDKGWTVEGDKPSLVVGRDNMLRLNGGAPACVESITLRGPDEQAQSLGWKVRDSGSITVTLPLTDRRSGALELAVKYLGVAEPSILSLRSYAEPSRLDGLTIHAGDRTATLVGQRLDQVDNIVLGDLLLRPDGLTREGQSDRLALKATDGQALEPGRRDLTAKVALRDGRKVDLNVKIAEPRPQIRLLGKTVMVGSSGDQGKALILPTDTLLPDTGEMTFSIAVDGGTRLSSADIIEVAAADGGDMVRLTSGKDVRMEGAHILVARLDPSAFGPGLFGPLRMRLVHDGEASDWQPLVTLARLPRIDAVACGAAEDGCSIKGRDLFLIDAVGATETLKNAARVAHGYTGTTLKAPLAPNGKLYLRLRDAPDDVVILPVG